MIVEHSARSSHGIVQIPMPHFQILRHVIQNHAMPLVYYLHAWEFTTSVLLCLALHLLADLDVDFEELCDAAVEADGLALVEIGFTVRGIDALLAAGLNQPGSCQMEFLMVHRYREHGGRRVNYAGGTYPVHQRKSAAWPSSQRRRRGSEEGLWGRGTYRAYMSETMSISASA